MYVHRRKGLTVQAFKVGPGVPCSSLSDYMHPGLPCLCQAAHLRP